MWIVIAFIAFIACASVAGTIADAIKKKAELELVRAAIEKGHALDPALVDKLMPAKENNERPSPLKVAMGLRIGGIMVLAFAVGLILLGYFISNVDEHAFPAMLGSGALFGCIGVGLFVASRYVSKVSQTPDPRA
jgi:hypothetical protein